MLQDRDLNGSGRTSRGPSGSAMSRAPRRQPQGAARSENLPFANPGVMSMLRTSTEMRVVAGVAGDLGGIGNIPRAPQRWGASSRLSTTSSLSNQSSRTSRHHREYLSSSSGPRRSSMRDHNGPQFVADALLPTSFNNPNESTSIPFHSGYKGEHRSRSMTNATQPAFPLSSNRSLGSLRSDHGQRSRSPYHYHTRLPRPGHRSGSPSSSEYHGIQSRRYYGYGSQEQLHLAGPRNGSQMNRGRSQPFEQAQHRLQVPSDGNIGQSYMTRRGPYYSGRVSSSSHYTEPGIDVPPVPPLPEQYGKLNKSAKESASNSSTPMRTDGGTPSSNITFPPTPKDGTSMEGALSPKATPIADDGTSGLPSGIPSELQFYNYGGQFGREEGVQNEGETIHELAAEHVEINGEMRPLVDRGSNTGQASILKKPSKAELRGTLNLLDRDRLDGNRIRRALEPSSTTGDTEAFGGLPTLAQDSSISRSDNTPYVSHDIMSPVSSEVRPQPRRGHRRQNSIHSPTLTSLLDSSTIEAAMRYPQSTAGDTEMENQGNSNTNSNTTSPVSPEQSTGGNISELLAGYQHTESRSVASPTTKPSPVSKKVRFANPYEGRKSRETLRSSEEQSFKSATDILPEQERYTNAYRALRSTPSGNAMTRDRASSALPLRISSTALTRTAAFHNRPASQMPLSSTPQRISHSNTQLDAAKSSPKVQQSLTSEPASSSSSGVVQQLPPVPHRESSTSREAQNMSSVSNFLYRQFHGSSRFVRGLTQSSKERTTHNGEENRMLSGSGRSANGSADLARPLMRAGDATNPREQVFNKPTAISENKGVPLVSPADDSDSKSLRVRSNSDAKPQSSNIPSPIIQDSSSVCSHQVNSLVPYVQPSSMQLPKHEERSYRDSHTTTHLNWPDHGLRSILLPGVGETGIPFPGAHEDTTTDLQIRSFRYPCSPNYLPALQEESHEDSSLNTSASNLKNSHFKLPFGGRQSLGMGADEAPIFPRSSMASHGYSVLGTGPTRSHNLPSMDFSHMNLLEGMNLGLGMNYSPLHEGVLTKPEESEEVEDDVQPGSAAASKPLPESCIDVPNESEIGRRILEQMFEPKGAMSSMTTAAELDQFRVPSVGALTQNISKILSPLRKKRCRSSEQDGYDEENEIMDHALEDMNEAVGPVQKRSSARLRPMPGSPNLVVMKDDVYEEQYSKEKENKVASHLGDQAGKLSAGEAASGIEINSTTKTPTKTRTKFAGTASKFSPPAATRRRALTQSNPDLRALFETPLASPRSSRSLESLLPTATVTDTRPWNFEKNYPWAVITPPVGIDLPETALVPQGLNSDASKASSFSSADTATASPFGTVSSSNARAPNNPFSSFGRAGDQHHAAGERYPTSALTPPTAIFRDHSSAFDTSDDEDFLTTRKHKLGLRKHFSSARKANRRKTGPTELDSPGFGELSTNSVLEERADQAEASTGKRLTFRNAEGMRTASYYRKKVFFKVRLWWAKGGNFFRKVTGRNESDSDGN